jgi:Fe-S cluster biogenesis protein NfuA
MKRKIQNLLNEIRPFIMQHGGDVELVSVKADTVEVKMMGACVGCSLSSITLKNGIESIIKDEFPEIVKVRAIEE